MMELANITYRLTVITETGSQYNVTNFVTDLGWEENENEIAGRISFTVRNEMVKFFCNTYKEKF